jgi:hypothetical protein
MPVSCSAYSVTLKMEEICSSETSVDFQRTAISQDRTLHNHCCENLKSYKKFLDGNLLIPSIKQIQYWILSEVISVLFACLHFIFLWSIFIWAGKETEEINSETKKH